MTAIGRRPRPDDVPPEVDWVTADLNDAQRYEAALEGAACVLHLAAVTGKARPAAYHRDNVEATRALLDACARADVRHVVLMSSIAAKFADRRFYPYADSKIAAEEIADASPVPTTIVRPTMILGPGSPIQAALKKLARLPVVPLFGDGRVQVQPVHVDEVVRVLGGLAHEPPRGGDVIELGGPEAVTMREVLARLRSPGVGAEHVRFLPLPLGPIRQALALLEGPLLPVLPLTAGQLASFANDSVADHHPAVDRLLAATSATPLRRERDEGPPDGGPPGRAAEPVAPSAAEADEAALTTELVRHARYLTGIEPTDYQIGKYLDFHRQRALAPRNGLDALLLRVSRLGWPGLALADAYGGALYRTNVVRAKLVLALAILECAPPSFEAIDAPSRGGAGVVAAGLALRLAAASLALLASAVVFAPAHAWLAATGGLKPRRTAPA